MAQPKYAQTILDHLVDLKDDGSFRLDLGYFDYCTGLTMTNSRFDALFGGKPRDPIELLDQRHMDLAASVQQVTEEIVLRLTRSLAREGQFRKSVSRRWRGAQLRRQRQDPARAQLQEYMGAARRRRRRWRVGGRAGGVSPVCRQTARDAIGRRDAGGYLGPSFSQAEIEARLAQAGAVFSTLADDALIQATVDALVAEKAVGWFQGRMEFGPRALGARSILGDPRSPTMQSSLNLRVKFRESFRPFAPAVLREDVADWFELDGDSPYMQLVADVLPKHRRPANPGDEKLFGIERLNLPRSDIPAVTHVDYSARIQTVHADTNPRFHALLTRVQGCDRMSGAGQHQLQRPRRADRVHAGRCLPLLHGQRYRGAGGRQLLPQQGGPAVVAQARLQEHVRTRLRAGRVMA